eukprot:760842-Hanusia_phi.AAC.3
MSRRRRKANKDEWRREEDSEEDEICFSLQVPALVLMILSDLDLLWLSSYQFMPELKRKGAKDKRRREAGHIFKTSREG